MIIITDCSFGAGGVICTSHGLHIANENGSTKGINTSLVE